MTGDSGNGQRAPRKQPGGRSCLLLLVAAVLAAAGLTAGTAEAGTARPVSNPAPCGTFDLSYGMLDNPPYAQADIESNPCNVQMRVHLRYVIHGLSFDTYSGWVEALELNTKATGVGDSEGSLVEMQQESDGGGNRMCEEFWPVKGAWHSC